MIIIIGFVKKVPRKWYWLICTAVLCLLVNTSEAYADLNDYTNIFNAIGEAGLAYNGSTPIGWTILCLPFYKLGFSYRGMILFVIIFCMFLIHYSIRDYSVSEGRFWSLFLVFPALVQCVQIRFFLATTIVFFSIQFLLKKGKRGLVQYILGIVVATLIHSSCVIFLAFVIVVFLKKVSFQKVVSLSLILSLAVAVFRNYLLSFISFLGIISQDKLSRYFYDDTENASLVWIILMVGSYLICIVCMWFFKNQTRKPLLMENSVYFSEDRYVLNRMISYACLIIFTLPLLLFDASMYRFIEVGMYMTFCLGGWYWENAQKPFAEKLFVSCVLCVPLYFVLRFVASVSAVLGPFFTFSGFHSLLR